MSDHISGLDQALLSIRLLPPRLTVNDKLFLIITQFKLPTREPIDFKTKLLSPADAYFHL